MKKKTIVKFMLSLIIVSFVALTVSTFTTAWFTGITGQTQGNVDGDIGLRAYYHCGSGDIDDPYVITRPSHLYNLARLQNRGIYPEKRYFQIGYVFDEEEGPVCLDDSNSHVKVLDMTSYCSRRALPPIGSEGTPFCSEINGNGIPIVGLRVEGNPEDVGVFGYVDSRGLVDNMIFKTLEVKSVGYSDGTTSSEDYSDDLFDRAIDDLFDVGSTTTFGNASLEWVSTLSSDPATIAANTENLKSTTGFPMNNINDPENLVYEDGVPTTRVIGYFRKHDPDPEEGDPFTYDWHTSSPLVKKAIINGEEVMVIDLEDISSGEFSSGGRMKCNSRISITASTLYKGVSYSRVIQSYDVEFFSNATTYAEGGYSATVYCDYVDSSPGSQATNYHHGFNIGLIAGHVDGSITDCYVYDGTLLMNGVSGNTAISSETETGLIGEIGTNVKTPINPKFGKKEYGETGVMNFSGIYNTIRRDFHKGDTIETRKAYSQVATLNKAKTSVSYKAGSLTSCAVYDVAKTEDSKFNKFADYLRHGYDETAGYVTYASGAETNPSLAVTNTVTNVTTDTTVENGKATVSNASKFVSKTNDTVGGLFEFTYDGTNWKYDNETISLNTYGITLTGTPRNGDTISVDLSFTTNASNYNSVDFLWNNVIADEYEDGKLSVDRGLGVFKIVTQYSEVYKWMYDHDIDPIEKGCYLDGISSSRIINGGKRRKVYYSTAECDWRKETARGTGGWTGGYGPLRASTIPSYSDIDSFEYPFSRDLNYCFEMNLSESNKPVGKNYFYNAQGFLLNYLESILINEGGTRLTPTDDRFGFLMCDSDGNSVDSVSSYMEVGNPGAFASFQDGDTVKQYPSNSIVFKIDNEAGANISVIGSEQDISVYRNWKNDTTGKPAGAGDIEELFTMRSKSLKDEDSGRYFPYTLHGVTTLDNPTGDPVSEGTGLIEPHSSMTAQGMLFAHTFKLPKGDYVLGSSIKTSKDSKARVYYLAVQGQDDSNLGRTSEVYMGKGVESVDFLLNDPVPEAPGVAHEYVKGTTTRAGVELVKAEFSFEGNFNTSTGGIRIIKKEDESCVQILFNEGFTPTNSCTTSLLAYCRKGSPRYYLNDSVYTEMLQPWPVLTSP